MSYLITSPSTVLPVTLEEVKDHLRVECDDEDAMLITYARAGTESVENITNRALVTQTVDLYLDRFPSEQFISLPRNPVQSVTGINYTIAGATAYGSTYAAANYTLDSASIPNRVVLKYNKTWPVGVLETDRPIRVRYVAGYGDAGSDVPEPIRAAILLQTGDLYENRENTVQTGSRSYGLHFSRAAEKLIAPYRVWY